MKIFIFLSLSLIFNTLKAQDVIATSGSRISTSTVQLDFTIGESIIETSSAGSIKLTQGFHQIQNCGCLHLKS